MSHNSEIEGMEDEDFENLLAGSEDSARKAIALLTSNGMPIDAAIKKVLSILIGRFDLRALANLADSFDKMNMVRTAGVIDLFLKRSNERGRLIAKCIRACR